MLPTALFSMSAICLTVAWVLRVKKRTRERCVKAWADKMANAMIRFAKAARKVDEAITEIQTRTKEVGDQLKEAKLKQGECPSCNEKHPFCDCVIYQGREQTC